jgi:hypothetical protein
VVSTTVEISTQGIKLVGFPVWIIWIVLASAVLASIGFLYYRTRTKSETKQGKALLWVTGAISALLLLSLFLLLGLWWGQSPTANQQSAQISNSVTNANQGVASSSAVSSPRAAGDTVDVNAQPTIASTSEESFMALIGWIGACAAVSIAVLIIAIVASQRFAKTLNNFTSDLRKLGNVHFQEVDQLLKKELSPSIHLHDGPDAVASRMEHIIRQVADDPVPENRQLTFYGAASLAAMPAENSDNTSETGEESVRANKGPHDETISPSEDADSANEDPHDESLTPSKVYWKAILHASNNQVKMRRYISLFTKDEIRIRSPRIQSQYVNWLRKQFQLLSDDMYYQLIDVPRAPQWGTNMARIIAKGVVMEITGNGQAAIVISDEHIAERIRMYARQAVTGKNVLVQPKRYGLTIGGSVEIFRKHVEEIIEVCEQAQAEDGEQAPS